MHIKNSFIKLETHAQVHHIIGATGTAMKIRSNDVAVA